MQKQAVVLLVFTFIFFCWPNTEIKAGTSQEQDFSISELLDDLWATAASKGLASRSIKPKLFSAFLPKNIYGMAEPGKISLDVGIIFRPTEIQKFVVAHEMGHILDNPWTRRNDRQGHKLSYRELRIREECRATILAAELIDDRLVVSVLEQQEKATRHKRKKVFSLLLAPVFLTIDTVNSLRFLNNEFSNPFSKYKRAAKIHGPMFERTLLVLNGKLQDCSCKQ
ncbi:MAG TPA: hypothetical protein VI978_03145 [Candidatus Paceibacterota bacterium]